MEVYDPSVKYGGYTIHGGEVNHIRNEVNNNAPPADTPDDPAAKEKHLVEEFGDWFLSKVANQSLDSFKIRQLNYNKAKCNLCDRELKLSDQGATTMKNHLFQLHKNEYENVRPCITYRTKKCSSYFEQAEK